MQKKYSAFLIFIFLMSIFTSCNKDVEGSYFELSKGETEMIYNETICADPWYDFFNKKELSSKNKDEKLKLYLDSLNIATLQIAYVKEANDVDVTCSACKCFSGAMFYVKLLKESPATDELKKLGFVPYNE